MFAYTKLMVHLCNEPRSASMYHVTPFNQLTDWLLMLHCTVLDAWRSIEMPPPAERIHGC